MDLHLFTKIVRWSLKLGILLGVLCAGAVEQYSTATSGVTVSLKAVTHWEDRTFVAVGTNGIILISSDTGSSWDAFSSAAPGTTLVSALAGKGRLLVGTDDSRVFWTTNRVSWQAEQKIFAKGFPILGLAFSRAAGGRIIAAAQGAGMAWATDSELSTWHEAVLGFPVFLLEGYRAVTSVGSNVVVACGRGGMVRRSPDGGMNWAVAAGRGYDEGRSTLMGITSRGQEIVCVGGNGSIIYSSDEGLSWSTTNTPGRRNLNSVAVSGTEFTAVGDGGLILTSTDGLHWIERESPTTNNLYQVTFGFSKTGEGTTVAVGHHGTIVVGKVTPPAPVSSGNYTHCAGTPSPTLRVTTTPFITADWYNTPTGGKPVLSSSLQWTPPPHLSNTHRSLVYYVEARDTRTQVVNPRRTEVRVDTFPRPTVSVSGTTNVCLDTLVEIRAALGGTAPWKVRWSDGVEETNSSGVSRRLIQVRSNQVYSVSDLSDRNCAATPSDRVGGARVTLNPSPTVTLNGDAEVCEGDLVTIRANLTGSGPWIVTWSDSTNQLVTNSPALRTFLASQTADYFVTSLSDQNCSAPQNTLNRRWTVRVQPRPRATLDGGVIVCSENPFQLTAHLSGESPWRITWSDGFVQTTNRSPAVRRLTLLNTNASRTLVTNFWIRALSDRSCSSRSSDLPSPVAISVQPLPTGLVTGATNLCNGDTAMILAALTGTSPWILTWSDGVTQVVTEPKAVRVVRPVNLGLNKVTVTNYFLKALSDGGGGCHARNSALKGVASVAVYPKPTASLPDGIVTLCSGSSNLIEVALTGTPPWTLLWSDEASQTVHSTTAKRWVSPWMSTNYSVKALTDLHCAAGAGDLRGRVAVTVSPLPTALVVGDHTICNGDSALLEIRLTGKSPWTLTWSDRLVQSNITENPVYRMVQPTNSSASLTFTNRYSLTALSSDGCQALRAGLLGEALVRVVPRPTALVSGGGTLCDGASLDLNLKLTGSGPWHVTWSDEVEEMVATPLWTRRVVPRNLLPTSASNFSYSVKELSDRRCASTTNDLRGVAIVRVNPRPGAFVSGSTNLCAGESTEIVAYLTGVGPWALTWSDKFKQTTNGSVARRKISVTTNVSYSILELTDKNCAAMADSLIGQATITAFPRPAAFVTTKTNLICNGESIEIQARLTGSPPWRVSWSDGVVQTSSSDQVSRTVTPTNGFPNQNITIQHTITNLWDARCAALRTQLTGKVVTTVKPRPTSQLTGGAMVCPGAAHTLQVFLTGSKPWRIEWSDGFVQTNSASPAVRTVSSLKTTSYEIVGLRDSQCDASTLDLHGVAAVLVAPSPPAPLSLGNKTNLFLGSINPPLEVAPNASTHRVDWYDRPVGGRILASGTNSIVVTNKTAGSVTLYAESRSDRGCTSTNRTPVTLVIELGLKADLQLSSNLVLKWFGNYRLQSSSRLTEPASTMVWTNLQLGVPLRVNTWTNKSLGAGGFYRLAAP